MPIDVRPNLLMITDEESMNFVMFCIKHDAWEHAIGVLNKENDTL
jgi:hypothetical protein